ncbi:DUF3499 domain-containing protein [Austwickia chelonae]|uniref:DUF3499 domain-containing protein n=1 Tax=Austwickia chelonae TaxID=100225 RepID=UPI000E22B716
MRRCSKTACSRAAVATLTYNYAEQTAVLGPLATFAEPHTYDLCATHAMRLTVPQGWEVVRLVGDLVERGEVDDLLAVADAVSARPPVRGTEPRRQPTEPDEEDRLSGAAGGRPATKPAPLGRPQLRVLRDI